MVELMLVMSWLMANEAFAYILGNPSWIVPRARHALLTALVQRCIQSASA